MSACSLQQIFENSLQENPKLLDSLSWKPIQHSSSFTEIFGELYFNESPAQSPSSSSSPHVCSSSFSEIINHANLVQNEEALVVSLPDDNNIINQTPSSLPCISTTRANKLRSDSFSSLSSESLNICTESLGFESSDEVEELKINQTNNNQQGEEEEEEDDDSASHGKLLWKSSRSLMLREYPPPISCIGRSGKPCVSFKSYRNNGRFVLKEIRIPTRDFLHAHREDGRLTLHFVQPTEEDEFLGGEVQEEEEDYDGVESTEEDEEENHGRATDQVNEEKKD